MKQFWKLKTTLTQNDQDIVLEADCRGYLNYLRWPLKGRMGFIFSNWENPTTSTEQFELELGQDRSGCQNASSIIGNFTINEFGSTEDFPREWKLGNAAP